MLGRPPNFGQQFQIKYIIITIGFSQLELHSCPPAKAPSANKCLCLQPVCGGSLPVEHY